MESTHNQEMQYQPFSGSNQQQQQYNINSNRAGYIDFYRQDGEVNVQTPHNPVITQNMGSASTQREVYSDDNNEVGFDSNALDINNINNMVGGEDYRPSNIKTLYHRDSNSDCEEELASLDMLSGLGGKSMKSDTRRQTIEVASKKILDNCLVDGGMPPVNKLHPNTQFQHKDFDARATNTQLQNGVTNMTNKQSFGGKAGTQNVGGGLSRQKQHNNLEVVLSNNDNAYGLQDQNEQNNYYSQTHKVQLQQNNKQTLAKSQSQNKLLFTSPGELQAKVYATEVSGLHPRLAGAQSVATINYQHPNQQIQIQSQQQKQQQQEKISFFKDQQHSTIVKGQPQGQDLLFKQHLQYSTGAGGGTTKNGGAYQLKLNSGHQHRFLSHNSTKECTYCNKTIGVSSGATVTPPCSAAICNDNQLGIMIQNDLSKKYSTNRDYYNVKIVNDLIYNENTHVVSIFKDYLILDDINEFLKRSYNIGEVKVRLPKLCSFYDKYSQVFPNFVVLPESKYMFKNIQRKQKLIDEQYQMQEELAKKQHQSLLDEDKMFSSKFYNSIYILNNNDLSMSMKQYEDQAKQISGATGNTQGGRYPNRVGGVGRIDQMKIDELVDRFLMKDSESNIQLTTTMGVDFSQSMIMMQPGNTSNINNPNKRLSSEFMPIKQQQQNNQQAQQKPKTKPVVQTKQLQQEQYSSSKNANNLMTPASKTGITNKEQPNSKVGKIQQNSIFSATQNIQTNNKAPGGTAQLGTGKKVNQDIVMSTTSKKSISSGAIATQLIQQSNQKRQKSSFNTNNQRGGLGGTGLLTNCLAGTATGGSVVSRQSDQNRLGANSAIGNQGGATQYNTLSVLPGGGTIGGNGGSNNTTPRLNKHFAYTSNQDNIRDQQQLAMHHAQQQQLSPDTKDAVANYLQLCQIEPTLDNQLSSNNIQSIDSGDKKNSGITGNSTSNGTGLGTKKGVYESPNTKSPSSQQIKRHSKKQTALISSGSQNAFASQSNAQSTLSLANNRQIMRSQLQGGMTSQQSVYTNLQSQQQHLIGGGNAIKKTTSRLSGGAAALRQGSTTMAKKQATSPVPQHIYNTNHQYSNNANSNNTLGASRNTIEQNSTLKSNKVAANLHAKYLSGGNDHYQRILNAVNSENNNAQQQQQQQIQQQQQQLNTAGGIYTTHDTLSTHGADNSASKKFQLSHQQKQPQVKSNQRFAKVQYNNVEGTDDVMSGPEPDLLTGEDCEGVADERLVSPDAFSTEENGRKSLDNRSGTGASLIGGANNMMLASIEGDKVLSQYTNYDQIKKHLERYIQHNHQSTDAKSTFKKFQEQSWDKQKQGGGIDGVASGGASLSNDTNNSRNAGGNNVGAAQKQFESLKQRIRGVFDSNTNSSDPHNQQQQKTKQPQTIQNNSINKTPIKGSSVSKKSQELAQIKIRMSIESREMLGVQPTDQVSGLLSTTSANARAFPFSQTGFVNNYRSTTNLQHRKGSNQNFINENSVENKRQSQKHPSFKDVQGSGDNKLFKRCATGKTLSINDVQQHNFGLQQQQLQMQQQLQTANTNLSGNGGTTTGGAGSQNNTQTLVNPTFINSKMKKSQQQQAANTVRVMTPSYSLASLSKVISPTQTTSPMTMTVTLAGQMQSRKQLGATHSALSKKIGNNSSGQSSQINQLSGTLMQSQSQHTFLLADKASKLISAAKGIQSSNSKGGLSLSSNKSSKLIGLSSTQNIKKQYQPALQQSNSLNNLQVGSTPRGGATITGGGNSQETFLRQTGGAPGGSGIGAYLYQQQQNQQLPHQEYSYQNMSCTAVSTENNSAVKTMESKHPKFMRTIEEYGVGGQQAYNNILSASMGGPGASTSIGQRKITASQSQAQLDLKQKQKLQQLGVANASSQIKKQLLASSSVSHLKTPSQQIHSKKTGGPSGGGSSKP